MAKKKNEPKELIQAPARPQPIVETIETNYMPYVMTVILSRAIPEIDGFKPSHRKLLYTMYKMGLLSGSNRTKSSNVVGQTMRLNPHGDAAIYETMVRLTRDNETLLHPFVDSKGAFGKQYSSDMKYAAPRYTEVKLDAFCAELFGGIDKDAVDMIDNYDGTMKEPTLLPTSFPNILVTPNSGIAVGMASDICSFNLGEICDGTIALLKKPNTDVEKLMDIIHAPDFSGGGELIYEREQMREIFETGQGSVRLRARYQYDKANNCIEVLQIPYSTTIEQIMKKMTDMIKEGKLKDVTDFRDEIDRNGFKLTIDLRRGVDPDKLMLRLYKQTPLESNFKCNFNVLVDATPKTLGVRDILLEWIKFRLGCVRREITYDLAKKKEKLHLLLGLGKILLDIDKAIRIIRKTEEDEKVIPNLMEGFSIDELQANYIADIKLRNLNKRYILDRIGEIESLQKELADMEDTLADEIKLRTLIAKQLQAIKQKFGQPRHTLIIQNGEAQEYDEDDDAVENIPVCILFTREGYFKKLSLRSNTGIDDQKLKEGDRVIFATECNNTDELVFFTDRAQMYRSRVSDFDITKASLWGDYVPSKLGMADGERAVMVNIQNSYPEKDHFVMLFENGKGVRVSASAYEMKGNRKKLTGAYSSTSPLVGIFYERGNKPLELFLTNSDNRGIQIKSALIPEMSTRAASGVQIMQLKKGAKLTRAEVISPDKQADRLEAAKGYRKLKVPATPAEITDKMLLEEPTVG